MPRAWRIEYAGACYHAMSRGNRREGIFHYDVDRQEFLRTLDQACLKTGWQMHAYCLMNNGDRDAAAEFRSTVRPPSALRASW